MDWVITEAVAQRCSIKKVFLEILQNSQENTCASLFFRPATLSKKKTQAQVFSCEFCETSKNTLYYRTPLMVFLWLRGCLHEILFRA